MRVCRIFTWLLLLYGSVLPGAVADAQSANSLTFTVTPPLIQLALEPGERWSSVIRVVNQNPYDITVYALPVRFTPNGETGRPDFTRTVGGQPVAEDPTDLPGWITVPSAPVVIPREQTYELPVLVSVPADAAPGGHYAAVLIGNTPPTGTPEESTVSVTSSIASLMFLRVAGNVDESGRIRELSTARTLYERPEAQFLLRFENTGNVHLQPQGDITIYNMFGKKRGQIAVNQGSEYGNVLPQSIREFAFTWQSDGGTWDIGRYHAEATLGYGYEAKSFAHATVYFWIVPVVPLGMALLVLVCAVWLFAALVRAYVRRALALETAQGATPAPTVEKEASPVATPRLTLRTLVRPIAAPQVDLRRGSSGTRGLVDAAPSPTLPSEGRHYLSSRVLLIGMLAALAVVIVSIVVFVSDAGMATRTYTTEQVDAETLQQRTRTP